MSDIPGFQLHAFKSVGFKSGHEAFSITTDFWFGNTQATNNLESFKVTHTLVRIKLFSN